MADAIGLRKLPRYKVTKTRFARKIILYFCLMTNGIDGRTRSQVYYFYTNLMLTQLPHRKLDSIKGKNSISKCQTFLYTADFIVILVGLKQMNGFQTELFDQMNAIQQLLRPTFPFGCPSW
ncbi:hypothetical protein BBR47_16880 [Brevibacillus brevis NBRC 100599]|uniref:Transposase n=1 Tax=Brevibacillus brevis (strain 47 / JCM 6285 / NBRC 100599) TaxID=358681 RepID=C0Z9J5_BREBN|nr:hypothetical protein BBR47_16880 [Brevibacillus brevis NBRC 100599]